MPLSEDYYQLIRDAASYFGEQTFPDKEFLASEKMSAFFASPKKMKPLIPGKAIPQPPVPTPLKPLEKSLSPPPSKPVEREKTTPALGEESWRKQLYKIAPHYSLHKEIPSDEEASRIAQSWKEKKKGAAATILLFGETGKELIFLDQLALAIQRTFCPCVLLEKERLIGGEEVKLFLSQEKVQRDPSYRYLPTTQESFIDQTPLLLLSPFSTYFKYPDAKKALWEVICSYLSS